jgi:hypothetical protein
VCVGGGQLEGVEELRSRLLRMLDSDDYAALTTLLFEAEPYEVRPSFLWTHPTAQHRSLGLGSLGSAAEHWPVCVRLFL